MTETPSWTGYHHVTLNVQDIEKSAAWYEEVLGFTPVTTYGTEQFQRIILRHPSGLTLGVNRHNSPEASEPFDERRAGLDHLALRVRDRDELERWLTHLEAHGVTHSTIKPGALPGASLITFRDPDNIQLELFAMPTT